MSAIAGCVAQGDAQAGTAERAVGELCCAAVQSGLLGDQGEAEAAARRSGVAAGEAVEEAVAVTVGDAGAVVVDGEFDGRLRGGR